MPTAAPADIRTTIDPMHVPCENCGGPVFYATATPWADKGTWFHNYPSYWYGQMICDPQQARAALKERQAHATP
jgi:hypothetical protein